MATALSVVQQFYPHVRTVKDAKDPLSFTVTDTDAKAVRKDHQKCAVAEACRREYDIDGVIISRSTAYLVKGRTATRYHIPQRVAIEIVSFDRGGGFAPGDYELRTPRIKVPEPGRKNPTYEQIGNLVTNRREIPGLRVALYNKK